MAVRRLNHAVLYIRDVPRAVEFYTDVLGFEVSAEYDGRAAFLRAAGTLNDHDLGLFAVGGQAAGPVPGQVGLYHLAWEAGTLGDLAAIGAKLQARGALVGASDHGVSKSFYAKDPDGIEFEVMWRVPREEWPTDHAGVERLDLDAALTRWGADLPTGAAAGSAT
ncbi:VOC family protein [Streptacidiphilus sp. PB12-B1b]|uniref:VOC family protein n=1 Tax=Streptacidiphilus sp. PB12-B1b TaxID=2705012 RepID=UPI0015FA3A20|nr:VOC family protein [Streptacidiphilus sp. PB12-B1b]QMU79441.1 VOC family protein [Streptacidiphilus sp. PB12-B1b]